MSERRTVPGDALLHPVAVAAVVLLVVNDHWLKALSPGGLVTGKLSDFSGLAFFPLFLQAGWEWLQSATDRWRGPSMRVLAVACIATGVVFAAVKTDDLAAAGYRWGLGGLQWLLTVSVGDLSPVVLMQDATDLVALPALVLSWWIGRARVVQMTMRTPTVGRV